MDTAITQAERVRSGAQSARELVDGAVRRIECCDERINSVVVRRFDEAVAEAAAPPGQQGPFAGVPILLKDFMGDATGVGMTAGIRRLAGAPWLGDGDSVLVQRLRRAGFVILGRTNVPELALQGTTEPLGHGPTRNPWSLAHSPGGSSGGAAAAVAAGLVTVAHANDSLGSIRIPAAACGVVGLKPTRGRLSAAPAPESIGGQACEGVITRTAAETRAVMEQISGAVPGDPWPPAHPAPDLGSRAAAPLRIGVLASDSFGVPVAPVISAAVARVATLLADAGHDVVRFDALDAPHAALHEPILTRMGAAVGLQLRLWSSRIGRPLTREDVEPLTWSLYERARTQSSIDLAAALSTLQQHGRRVGALLGDCDVLLSPTVPTSPARIGSTLDPGDILGSYARSLDAFAFTLPFNLGGQPAISVPVGLCDERLPVAVQLAARHWHDGDLLALAGQLEMAPELPA